MSYKVFTRNWYKKDSAGNIVPDSRARKTTKCFVDTEEQAREMCGEHNKFTDPGLLSNKAEYMVAS